MILNLESCAIPVHHNKNIDIYSLNNSKGIQFQEQHVVVLSEKTYQYPSSESNINTFNLYYYTLILYNYII